MADGYLESRYADYEKRKAEWLKKRKHLTISRNRHEDEAL